MDLLKGNIKKIFFKYFAASLAGALVISVYSLVDCIMVGQYEGPAGSAAIATIMPVWNIILSLGMLFGIGGAVLMSAARGKGDEQERDRWFTTAFIGICAVTAIVWVAVALWGEQMLRLFGADDKLVKLGMRYIKWITYVIPLFMLGQAFSAFIRNDGAPGLTSVAVSAGGVLNIIGDYYFVFVRDMGIEGAGLATALGQLVGFTVICTHFISNKCTLKLVRPCGMMKKLGAVIKTGAPTFIVDVAAGFMILLFNRQIMAYYDSDVLSIYGVICNAAMTVQALIYSVGNAAQPIMSVNYTAGEKKRVSRVRTLSFGVAIVISVAGFALCYAFPEGLVRIFMDANEHVLAAAPHAMRTYFYSFLLLGFNIISTYYFQAVLRSGYSLIISILRSVVVSGTLILGLPAIFGGDALWWVMPITETCVAIVALVLMLKKQRGAAAAA